MTKFPIENDKWQMTINDNEKIRGKNLVNRNIFINFAKECTGVDTFWRDHEPPYHLSHDVELLNLLK